MVNDFLITSIQTIVKENILGDGIKLYIFGSTLFVPDPKDIDLLLAYDSRSIELGEIVIIRRRLNKLLETIYRKELMYACCLKLSWPLTLLLKMKMLN